MHDLADPSRSGVAFSWHCQVPHEGPLPPESNGEAHIRPRGKKAKSHAAGSGLLVVDWLARGKKRAQSRNAWLCQDVMVAGVPVERTPALDEDLDPLKQTPHRRQSPGSVAGSQAYPI